METTINTRTYTLQIPQSDVRFLSTLAKKMGWEKKQVKTKIQARNKCSVDFALEEIASGNVGHAKDVDDLFKQILG